ncbi:MAG: ATPase domain-containing protein [Candidatus Aenigmatarchaeota archaeon]
MSIERVSTGIVGLDKLLNGGYPKNSVILVAGGPGSGKTTFAMQYIYHGAKSGEPGVYISFEQEPEQLKNSMKQFGMDFDEFEKEQKVIIIRIKKAEDIKEVLKIIESNVKKINAKRLVIDSLGSLEVLALTFKSMMEEIPLQLRVGKLPISPPKEAIIRKLMYNAIDYLKSLNVTTILTSEAINTEYSRYGIAEFIVDGIIKLEYQIVGKAMERNLSIIKMRETPIEGGRYGIEIGKKGLRIV